MSHSSPETLHADVAIAGAGPAGAAAALHLAQLGVRNVVLVDRADFPRDKTCGSGISPKGIQVLQKLGVWSDLEPHAYWIQGLRLVTPRNRELTLSGGKSAAAVVCNRRVMDEIIVRRAQALGARFVPNFLVRSPIEEDGRVAGFRGDDGREVRARFTFVADGGHSRLVLEREPRQILQAIMGWWEGVPFTPQHVEMLFDPLVAPWYAWLFPESATRVNIGICYQDDAHALNARALFDQVLQKHFAERLRGAHQVGGWKGHPILYSYDIHRLGSPGRFILGEAGRMVHPATGEGIYQGMTTGMLAAEAVRDILQGGVPEAQALQRYELQCRKAFRLSFLSTKVFHRVLESPVLDWVAQVADQPTVKRFAGKLLAQM